MTYVELAKSIGELVDTKQGCYGDSFGKSGLVMRVLYPRGVPPEKLDDALVVIRVIDKLFRVATARDALGESPWRDVAGYALLATARVEGHAKADELYVAMLRAEVDRLEREVRVLVEQEKEALVDVPPVMGTCPHEPRCNTGAACVARRARGAMEMMMAGARPGQCEDCGQDQLNLITKSDHHGDHHGGEKVVCVDRVACHTRSGR